MVANPKESDQVAKRATVPGVDLDVDAHARAQDGRVGLAVESAIRTGIRCTTLTQLPLEFCAGRTENSEPLAGLMLSTVPDQHLPGIGIDRDVDVIAGPDVGEVGLLHLGGHPYLIGGDQRDRTVPRSTRRSATPDRCRAAAHRPE